MWRRKGRQGESELAGRIEREEEYESNGTATGEETTGGGRETNISCGFFCQQVKCMLKKQQQQRKQQKQRQHQRAVLPTQVEKYSYNAITHQKEKDTRKQDTKTKIKQQQKQVRVADVRPLYTR